MQKRIINSKIQFFSEHHCLLPSDPINGHRNCTESNLAVYCSLSCLEGYAFAIQPSQVKISRNLCIKYHATFFFLKDYVCPRSTEENIRRTTAIPVMTPGLWLPETNPLPFPDCSVVSHSSLLMTPTSLTLDIKQKNNADQSSSVCDDPLFLKEVSCSNVYRAYMGGLPPPAPPRPFFLN
jgi:hypothetical protein